ncbi:MAG: biopolymer transporter ExbD [Candidatus Nitrohelix vancouverensis]|uniref:Biopolymer transporter ExbD n=1 Tax=Candidatus Nitrohelix vancouverensis TaxID=2705534 RepID=A0A7T0C0H7_9BACT|nr:MAG: biopolymer transporter ExbD [Candidatus Nitrohelix vancouverensis]
MLSQVKPKRKLSKLDMAPLIDVVFLLLIFFMLTFAIQSQGIEISLPQGESMEAPKLAPITISMNDSMELRIDDQRVALNELKDTLSAQLKKRDDKRVLIEAHKNTPYEGFAKVLDLSRLAGAEGFSIVKQEG